jgi:hypothetical protein
MTNEYPSIEFRRTHDGDVVVPFAMPFDMVEISLLR